MAINPKIKEKAEKIRKEVYGKDVREALASGLEVMSEDVEETKQRQDNVESQFQAVLDETTGKDVISAPEITAARVGADDTNYPNLKERLDTEYQKLSSQLAQIAINVKSFGAKGDGVTNDYEAFVAAVNTANQLDVPLLIPYGFYYVDGPTIDVTTDIECFGVIIIPHDTPNKLFYIRRTKEPIFISIENLHNLSRNSTKIGLQNYANYDLFLQSDEILIMRHGFPDPYYKTDMVRLVDDNGTIIPALDCTYTDKTKLSAIAYEKERPLVINNLAIETVGTGEDKYVMTCERSDVTFNNLRINKKNTSAVIKTAIDVVRAINVNFNTPVINGANASASGLGYGISFSSSSLCNVYDGQILNCRHAISGRHMNTIKVVGGEYDQIDSHWGNNLQIEKATLHHLVTYAGSNIHLKDITVLDAPMLLAIRNDTPELSGTVEIENIKVNLTQQYQYDLFTLVGFSSQQLTGYVPGRTIINPEYTLIKNINVYSEKDVSVWGVFSHHNRTYPQTYWKRGVIDGFYTNNLPLKVLEFEKDTDYYEKYNANWKIKNIDFSGNAETNTPSLVLRSQGETDPSYGFLLYVEDCKNFYPMINTDSCILAKFKDTSFHYRFSRVAATENIGEWIFDNCHFKDVEFIHEGEYDFNHCIFEGTITAYPNNLSERTKSNINPLVKIGCTGYPPINKVDSSKYIVEA